VVVKVSWEQALAWRLQRHLLDPIRPMSVARVVRHLSANWLAGGWFGKRQLRTWFDALGGRLVEVDVEGDRALALAEDVDELVSTKPRADTAARAGGGDRAALSDPEPRPQRRHQRRVALGGRRVGPPARPTPRQRGLGYFSS
jgi:hypothetical protein